MTFLMNYKIKNIFYKTFKAIINSTLSRKKKRFYIKIKKLKNIKLKLQLITYKILSQSLKYISIYQNYKSNFNSIPIFI